MPYIERIAMDSTFEGYYTPNNVAKFIVSRIPKIQVSTVADICAGSGSLINAALNRWGKSICCRY